MKMIRAIALLLSCFAMHVMAADVQECWKTIQLNDMKIAMQMGTTTLGTYQVCMPKDAPEIVRVVTQNGQVKSVGNYNVAHCGADGICQKGTQFIGNAPQGNYIIQAEWYIGPDSHGKAVSYRDGTGPGYGGNYYDPPGTKPEANPLSTGAIKPLINPPDISCIAGSYGTEYGCMLGDQLIEDADLPNYLPLVDEAEVKKIGGSCQSVPMCFTKDYRLLGLNKRLF